MTTDTQGVEQTPEIDDQASDAAFAAGLDDAPTATPARTEQPSTESGQAEPEGEAQPAPKFRQVTEDEWNQLLTRAAKADEVDSLKATLEKSLGTAFGKLGGIERTLNEKLSGRVGNVTLEDVPESLRAELPEIADALVEVVNKAAARGPKQPQAEDDGLTFDERVARAVETRALTKAHPDWQQVRDTQEFQAHVMAMPEQERSTFLNAWDAEIVSKVISDFKAKRAKPSPPAAGRRNRIEAAATPSGTGGHSAGADTDDPFLAGLRGD